VDLAPTIWKIHKNHINPQHPLGHSPIFHPLDWMSRLQEQRVIIFLSNQWGPVSWQIFPTVLQSGFKKSKESDQQLVNEWMNAALTFNSFVKVFQVTLVRDEDTRWRAMGKLLKKPFEINSMFPGPSFSCLRCKVQGLNCVAEEKCKRHPDSKCNHPKHSYLPWILWNSL